MVYIPSALNRRHDGVGHVFQGRFKSILVQWNTLGSALDI